MQILGTMEDLLHHELSDLLDAENQMLEALPKMASAANDEKLKEGFEEHAQQTEEQARRLQTIFEKLGKQPSSVHCDGMEGLLNEGEEILKAEGDPLVKDAALIAAAQRVEHYEMAGYGAAHAHAKQLGLDDVADLLQETLNQEGATDKKLTKAAEGGLFSSGVNDEARR
jgi:ferritin-like metal-binding protein YciE